MLGACLESVAAIADQLVVLDTGSTDRTVEIAESFAAEIHYFDWCEDFSAARNESIKYATGDWILWLDADERLPETSIPALKKLLKVEFKPVIYRLRIKNLQEDGINFTLSDAHRLFTNHRGLRFSGRIHEQISPSAKKIAASERTCLVMLDHLGYSFSGIDKTRKQDRNRKMLENELLKNPANAYNHYTLAHNYKLDNKLDAAAKHYLKALELDQFESAMQASLMNSYADTLLDLGRLAEALPFIERSLDLHKNQNAAYFLKYRVAELEHRSQDAIQALEDLALRQEQIQKQGTSISTDIEADHIVLRKTIADLYFAQKQWPQAAKNYQLCLDAGDKSELVLKSYFKSLEQLEDWPGALDVLGKLIQLTGESPLYLNAIGTILLRMKEYQAALQTYLRLNHLQPREVTTCRKIASIYAKMGNVDKAQEWLT